MVQVTELVSHTLSPGAQRPDSPRDAHHLSCKGQKKCVSMRTQQLKGFLKDRKSEMIGMQLNPHLRIEIMAVVCARRDRNIRKNEAGKEETFHWPKMKLSFCLPNVREQMPLSHFH